jgi:putative redox protein
MKYKFEKPLRGTIGITKYQCKIEWRNGQFVADEPESNGGRDEGPDPFTLLLSSLTACTLITLRMYIDRKGWDVSRIAVNTNMYQEVKDGKTTNIIDRDLLFLSPVTDDQKIKLQEITAQCPVSKLLEGDTKIRTYVYKDNPEAKTVHYANDDITIDWKPELCQHSTRCWTQLLQVFDPRLRRWINIDGASAERVREQVAACPSGALLFHYNKDIVQPETEKLAG